MAATPQRTPTPGKARIVGAVPPRQPMSPQAEQLLREVDRKIAAIKKQARKERRKGA